MSENQAHMPHILIVEARFDEALSGGQLADALLEGAIAVFEDIDATYQVVTVPTIAEVPAAIAFALDAEANGGTEFDGYVVLGTIIRKRASDVQSVDIENADDEPASEITGVIYRVLTDLAVSESLAIGNGFLNAENEKHALALLRQGDKDKGGFAARTVLTMINVKKQLGA